MRWQRIGNLGSLAVLLRLGAFSITLRVYLSSEWTRMLTKMLVYLNMNQKMVIRGDIGVGSYRKETGIKHILLPLQSKPIHNKDLSRQKDPCHSAFIQSNTEEVQSAPPIHRRPGDVERKTSNRRIHQNAKVITKVGPSQAEDVHARQHEHGAHAEKHPAKQWLVDGCIVRLVIQRLVVHVIAEETQREYGEG